MLTARLDSDKLRFKSQSLQLAGGCPAGHAVWHSWVPLKPAVFAVGVWHCENFLRM